MPRRQGTVRSSLTCAIKEPGCRASYRLTMILGVVLPHGDGWFASDLLGAGTVRGQTGSPALSATGFLRDTGGFDTSAASAPNTRSTPPALNPSARDHGTSNVTDHVSEFLERLRGADARTGFCGCRGRADQPIPTGINDG